MPTGGLLVAFAHPDDETLASGTMAYYAAQRVPVTMICATRGEVGEIAPDTGATPDTLGEYRERELHEAMSIIGVDDVRFLGFRDSGMAGTEDNEDQRALARAHPDAVTHMLVRAIRELKPAVVVTWDATGGYGHPDHIAIHTHTTAAFHAAADSSRFPTTGEPWQPKALFYSVIPISEFMRVGEEMRKRGLSLGDAPGGPESIAGLEYVPSNCVMDVTEQWPLKQKALDAHRTQVQTEGPFAAMPEDLRRDLFSREHFHRAHPPAPDGLMLTDLFDGLDVPSRQ